MSKRIIDISNYEEWIVDYHDSVLSEQERAQLFEFVSVHPNLKEDLEGIDDLTLKSESATFDTKELLYRFDSGLNEQELIEAIEEGTISEPELTELMSKDEELAQAHSFYLKSTLSPLAEDTYRWKDELKSMTSGIVDEDIIESLEAETSASNPVLLADYKKSVLVADQSVVFDEKSSLKRSEKKRGLIIPLRIKQFAVAASILLLAGLFMLNKPNAEFEPRQGESLSSKIERVDSRTIEGQVMPDEAPVLEQNLAQKTKPTEVPVTPEQTVNSPMNIVAYEVEEQAPEEPVLLIEDEGVADIPLPTESAEDTVKTGQPESPIVNTPEEDVASILPAEVETESSSIENESVAERAPDLGTFIQQKTSETFTGDKDSKVGVLDVAQKIADETELFAMKSNHKEESAVSRFKIKFGSVEISRTRKRK